MGVLMLTSSHHATIARGAVEVNAGSLRHPVQIQRPVDVTDGFGAAGQQNWETIATVWAAIEPASAREFVTAQQMAAEVNTLIRIRYFPGITPKMRVLYGTRWFDIQGIIDVDERHRHLHLVCVERNV